MEKRTPLQWLMITLKGMGMGAADVVPGVSGGTIAFITGIYEELISSLSAINFSALKVLKSDGITAAWKHINGNFFVALFLGIAISIVSLAKIVTFLLATYPVLVWSFFFGLVIASAVLVLKTVKSWNVATVLAILIGITIAAWISLQQTTASGDSLAYIFLSGAIAICAMILPGISGAFILVLLGSYSVVLTGLKEFDVPLIVVFALGCVTGLITFSKVLKYLFEHYKKVVLALLSGFLIGSLVKIWPWKNPVGTEPIIVHSDGREEFMMQNVAPNNFYEEPQLFLALALAFSGFIIIVALSKFAPKDN